MVLGRLEPEASPHWSQASSLSAEARHNFLDELSVVVDVLPAPNAPADLLRENDFIAPS